MSSDPSTGGDQEQARGITHERDCTGLDAETTFAFRSFAAPKARMREVGRAGRSLPNLT